MRIISKKAGLAACLAAVAAISLTFAGPASADTAARNGDAVGVGSDTLEFVTDFVLDGAPGVSGGFNNVGNNPRIFNVFATGDADGRLPYDGTCGAVNTGTTGLAALCGPDVGGSNPANATAPNTFAESAVTLRAGTHPVTRPNGSGAGVKALIADATGYQGLPAGSIQFARMSRLPATTGGEEDACGTSTTCGGLHVYQIATDSLGIAHIASAAYQGPSGGLSDATLYKIFVSCAITTWNQIPGNTSGSTETIHPLIPQSGSGTRTFFLTDLNNAVNGVNSAATPGACTRSVEEHDPTGIYQDDTPQDAIEPFSAGRLELLNGTTPNAPAEGAYFTNAGYTGGTLSLEGHSIPVPQGAFTPGLLTIDAGGTATTDSSTSYTSGQHGVYIVMRQPDVANTSTPFLPGGTQNLESTLFAPFTGVFTSAGAKSEIKASGFTPAFVDCGINPVTC